MVLRIITASGRARIHERIKNYEWFDRAMADSATTSRIVSITLEGFIKKIIRGKIKNDEQLKYASEIIPGGMRSLG